MKKKIQILKFILPVFILLATLEVNAQRIKTSSDSLYDIAKDWGQNRGNYVKALEAIKLANKKAPRDIDIQEYLGKCYLELKQYDKARYILRKAADARLQNYTALLYLLNVEHQTKRYSSAICYINEMLEQTPYEKGLWIKKMNLYKEMGNEVEALRELKRIKQIFPEDHDIQRDYIYILEEEGKDIKNSEDYDKIKNIYESILEEDPDNKEAYLMLIKNELENKGDKTAAINYASIALKKFPQDPQIIRKNIGLMEELGQYNNAMNLLDDKKQHLKLNEYNELNTYLQTRAANYYENTNPYIIYKKIYAENPANREALNYIIKTALAKRYYSDAEYYINKGLKKTPTSKDLLSKKLALYKALEDENKYNKTLEEIYDYYPEDEELQYLYQLNKFEKAKSYLEQGQLYEAKSAFLLLRNELEWEILANEQLYNIAMKQEKYDKAMEYANYLIERFPDNPDYQLNKSNIYFKTQRYPEGLKITGNLTKDYPDSEKYKDIHLYQLSMYVNDLMKNEEYAQALEKVNALIEQHPSKSLYLYSMNAALAMEHRKKAIDLGEKAIEAYPNDKDIALKLADAYLLDYKTDWTIALLEPFHERNPYDMDIKKAIAIAYYKRGMYKKRVSLYTAAYADFTKSVDYMPKDNPAVTELISAYKKAGENLRALTYLNGKIKSYPWLDNLKVAKGKVYENLKEFDSALYYQKYYKPDPSDAEEWKRHIEYLTNKTYDNQIDASYIRFDSDSTVFVNRMATLHYTKFYTNNAYGIGANYVAREIGAGVQLTIDWQHTFSPTVYGKASYFLGTKYFPKHRLQASIFKNLENNWEVELGARYDRLQDSRNLVTGIVGASTTVNNFWLNARFQYLKDFDDNYTNLVVRSKYAIENRRFVQLIASVGTAPYDQKLAFQYDTFFDFVHTMVGAGYQWPVNRNIAFGFYGNWYNYKISEDYFQNQYQLTMLCEIKF